MRSATKRTKSTCASSSETRGRLRLPYPTHRVLLGDYPTPVEALPAFSRPGTAVWI
jgi:hypothetical protein